MIELVSYENQKRLVQYFDYFFMIPALVDTSRRHFINIFILTIANANKITPPTKMMK